MRYRCDVYRLAVQLLPPVLRGAVLVALLRVLVSPLRRLYGLFAAYQDATAARLDITANVIYIQKALNDAFYLDNGQIYIVSAFVSGDSGVLRLMSEGQRPPYLRLHGEGAAYYFRRPGEARPDKNFYIHVPTFLCTSLDPAEDRYKGVCLRRVRELADYYKPAGRSYGIILYDYD